MNIVPFYPLRVLPSEDYFKADLIYAFGEGFSTDKIRYFKSVVDLYKSIPDNEDIYCQGMTKQMIGLYLLLQKGGRLKDIIPHTTFGKYPIWGFPINISIFLKPILNKFCRIRATSPYEYEFYKKIGLFQVYYEPLYFDENYFSCLRSYRCGTGVLTMGGARSIKNVKTVVKACDIAKRKLTILGDVEPGNDEFNNAFIANDIFVDSSYMAGFSLGIGEAHASGMKLCLSNLPTTRSIYQEKAFYHEPDDYEQLAKNINNCTRI